MLITDMLGLTGPLSIDEQNSNRILIFPAQSKQYERDFGGDFQFISQGYFKPIEEDIVVDIAVEDLPAAGPIVSPWSLTSGMSLEDIRKVTNVLGFHTELTILFQ
jgi:hypothetical protein